MKSATVIRDSESYKNLLFKPKEQMSILDSQKDNSKPFLMAMDGYVNVYQQDAATPFDVDEELFEKLERGISNKNNFCKQHLSNDSFGLEDIAPNGRDETDEFNLL